MVLMGHVAWKTPTMSNIEYIEIYQPSAALRFPEIREKSESDFDKLEEKVVRLQ